MITAGLEGNSIAVAFSALRFTIGPLGNERPNKWIHQSVCVLLSVCICDAVRPGRAQSPGTQRKGMALLAGLMNGWHAAPWQRRMWQPPSRKRGAVLNYQWEIMWYWPPPLPSYIPHWLSPRRWKNQREKTWRKQNIRLSCWVTASFLLPAHSFYQGVHTVILQAWNQQKGRGATNYTNT